MNKISLLFFVALIAVLLVMAGCSSSSGSRSPPSSSGGGCGVTSYSQADSLINNVAGIAAPENMDAAL